MVAALKIGGGRDQFRAVSDDAAQAVALVGGGWGGRVNRTTTSDSAVKVLALVHECWEASVRLLGELHPMVVSGDIFRSGVKVGSSLGSRGPESGQGAAPVSWSSGGVDVAAIRTQARTGWLADEYAFYDASVAQFR